MFSVSFVSPWCGYLKNISVFSVSSVSPWCGYLKNISVFSVSSVSPWFRFLHTIERASQRLRPAAPSPPQGGLGNTPSNASMMGSLILPSPQFKHAGLKFRQFAQIVIVETAPSI